MSARSGAMHPWLAAAFAAAALAAPFALADNRFLAFVLGMTFINLLWAAGMNLSW